MIALPDSKPCPDSKTSEIIYSNILKGLKSIAEQEGVPLGAPLTNDVAKAFLLEKKQFIDDQLYLIRDVGHFLLMINTVLEKSINISQADTEALQQVIQSIGDSCKEIRDQNPIAKDYAKIVDKILLQFLNKRTVSYEISQLLVIPQYQGSKIYTLMLEEGIEAIVERADHAIKKYNLDPQIVNDRSQVYDFIKSRKLAFSHSDFKNVKSFMPLNVLNVAQDAATTFYVQLFGAHAVDLDVEVTQNIFMLGITDLLIERGHTQEAYTP